MIYRLEPQSPVSQSVRLIAASQIEDILSAFGDEPPSAKAVHETRKAVKRLRALLTLVRRGLEAEDLHRERDRLRAIAHSLAGARDAHVMLETATALQEKRLPRDCRAAGRAVIARLGERREEAGQQLSAELSELPVERLRDALAAMHALPVDRLDVTDLLAGFTQTYRRGRKLQAQAFAPGADDERVHDLRKQVQQHWRHLQLLAKAWPKGLRPHIALARELSETLGKDHDIAVLAGFAREMAAGEENGQRLTAYAEFCAGEQERLRRHAVLLARRLYAEKPKSLRRRLKVYWETAQELIEDDEPDGRAKVVPIKR
jgi:CHAD domain-containing protein